MNTVKEFTIKNLENDGACYGGLEYAKTLMDRNLPAFATCVAEGEEEYASWLLEQGYVEVTDANRQLALQSGGYMSYSFAKYGDCGPRDDTRNAVLGSGSDWLTYCYARSIDKGPRDDTRKALMESDYKRLYALFVDKIVC